MPEITESEFERATDPSFKARAVSEYRRVRHWVADIVVLDTAKILDFGCGEGVAAASFALRHPNSAVVGVDIVPPKIDSLNAMYERQIGIGVPENLRLDTIVDGSFSIADKFDFAYAWSVFHHLPRSQVVSVADEIRESLKEQSLLFVQVEPLYFSERGSLLYNYFSAPWHHLMVELDALRERLVSEGASPGQLRDWQQFMELNRMTADEIISAIEQAGFDIIRREYFTTKSVPPQYLLDVYQKSTLTTSGFQALFRRR